MYCLGVAGAARAQPSAPTEAEISSEREAEYRSVVARAVSEFDSGHAAEARALFLRAHELWPSARTRRTLGMTAFELRMYPQALEELQSALEDPHRPLTAEQRTQVLDLVARTKTFIGRYQLRLVPADAEVLVDGAPVARAALVLGLGSHRLLVRRRGYRALQRELRVQGGEDDTLILQLKAAPLPQQARVHLGAPTAAEPTANRTPAWIAFGVAAASLAIGGVSGSVALSKRHDIEDLQAGYQAADLSTGAFITAGVAAAAGALLWIYAPHSGSPDAQSLGPLHVRIVF